MRCNICGRQPPESPATAGAAAAVSGADRRYHLAMPGIWDGWARADVNGATRMALGEPPTQAKGLPSLKIALGHHRRQFDL
jgi:hypothetical protein